MVKFIILLQLQSSTLKTMNKEKEFKTGELALLRNKVPVIIIKQNKEKLVSYNQMEDKKVNINKTYLCLIRNSIDIVSERVLSRNMKYLFDDIEHPLEGYMYVTNFYTNIGIRKKDFKKYEANGYLKGICKPYKNLQSKIDEAQHINKQDK